jgi:signal transduction histidine kinase
MGERSFQSQATACDSRHVPVKGHSPPSENQNGILASLAHEINNPLQALLNALQLMQADQVLSENNRRHLAVAGEEARRISRILHAAMEFRDTDTPENTDVSKLVQSVLDFYKSRLDSRDISVNTRFPSGAHLSIYPYQLRQLCANLVVNAADATPRGGKIYARVAPSHEWKGHRRGFRLTFADTGTGIAAKSLSRIWDPFFTTKGAAGNGIGLSLVKNTVEKHHGGLRVRSSTKAGHSGTVFSIFLPCA